MEQPQPSERPGPPEDETHEDAVSEDGRQELADKIAERFTVDELLRQNREQADQLLHLARRLQLTRNNVMLAIKIGEGPARKNRRKVMVGYLKRALRAVAGGYDS